MVVVIVEIYKDCGGCVDFEGAVAMFSYRRCVLKFPGGCVGFEGKEQRVGFEVLVDRGVFEERDVFEGGKASVTILKVGRRA